MINKSKKSFLILAILCGPCLTLAQQKQVLSAAATSCSVSGTSCLINSVDPSVGGVTFTVSANASANTLQFEASGDGGTTWVAFNVIPSNSSTAASSTTSTGTWQGNVAGYTHVRIRMSTLAGGTSTVSIISSFASARAGGGGGGSGGTQVLNLYTQFGAVHDAHPIIFQSNGANAITITTGSCSTADNGKNIFGVNTVKANAFSVAKGMTIGVCTPPSAATLVGGTIGGFSAVTGWIGTDDSVALNACLVAASAANGTCYAPPAPTGSMGTAYFIGATGQQIPTNGSLPGPYNWIGDSMDSSRFVFPPFAYTSNLFIFVSGTGITIRDMSFDNGGTPAVTAGGGSFGLVLLNNSYTYRVRASNWQGNSEPCLYFSNDGLQATEIESSGCFDGAKIAATGMHIFRPNISNCSDVAMVNGDASLAVFGGTLSCNNSAFLGSAQGAFGTAKLVGIQMNCGTAGCNVVNTNAATAQVWIDGGILGGSKGCGATTNQTDINIVSGARVTLENAQNCSSGTGVGINNAGVFVNQGGNVFPAVGASRYSGAGTAIANAGGEGGTIACSTSAATIVFGNSYGSAPVVTIQDRTTAGVVTQTSISATQIVVGCPGATDNLNYVVTPNPI